MSAARPGRVRGPYAVALARIVREPAALFGLVVVAGFVCCALFAPYLSAWDPIATNWGAIRKAPSALHWLGTDELGRDIVARLVWGSRASLLAGLVSVSIALGIGVPIGLLAGYAGGVVDYLIGRLNDAVLACPFLITAIALAALLGPSLANAMIAIGVAAAPVFVRLTRGQAVGNTPWRIAWRHILPNALAPLSVQATLAVASAVIAEASLSFLGLGQQPPEASWGSMLNTAKNYLENAPWMSISPGAAIFLLVLALNLLGDGLRDALDPQRR